MSRCKKLEHCDDREWCEQHAACRRDAAAKLVRVMFLPMLINGCVGPADAGLYILIDSEQDEAEQGVTLYHEMLHLVGLEDEVLVEALAKRLHAACPELLHFVKAAHGE